MDALKAQFKQLAERIDTLAVRERGLIFIAVMGVLYLIAYNIVFGPLRAEHARLERTLKAKYDQSQTIDRKLSEMFSGTGTDVGAQNRNKIAALKQQLTELDAGMDRMTAGVVTPKEMTKLVEQMLSRNKNLELVKLEALPPMSLDEQSKLAPDGIVPAAAPGVSVYRHGMRIQFKGRYFDIVDYLQALEKLQWKVFWGEISLEADKYPVSKVTLVIYTLSRYPGWIGV
jgi:MSHA biogenesis protein MshJ